MNIQTNYPLRALNSFGFDVQAERYIAVNSEEELITALATADKNNWPVFILGGGSNLIITGKVQGLVIHLTNEHTQYSKQANGETLVTASAGKLWHDLVIQTLQNGLTGLENLSLIPGNCGAAPVQNIGAYGVELMQRLNSVRAFHKPSARWLSLSTDDCEFAYRDSIFKRNPNQYIITEISFMLHPALPAVTHYSALSNALSEQNLPSNALELARTISATIINIRQSKLPNPAVLGNAGSFFKNPVVSAEKAAILLQAHPNLVHYPQPDGQVKLAAGWLIDQQGWRGHRQDGVGVHTEQALVLVHHGNGSGAKLMQLANNIMQDIQQKYDVRLEIEPVML